MMGLSEKQMWEIIKKAVKVMPKAKQLTPQQRKQQIQLLAEVLEKMGWQISFTIFEEDATAFIIEGKLF